MGARRRRPSGIVAHVPRGGRCRNRACTWRDGARRAWAPPCSAAARRGSPPPTCSPGAVSPASSSRPAAPSAGSRGRSSGTATASTSAGTASSRSWRRSQRLWEEMLGDEFLTRPRLSRIYYQGKFLAYPLVARDVCRAPRDRRVGPLRPLVPRGQPRGRAGVRRRPSRSGSPRASGSASTTSFFRSYTEKVWGIPGSEIRAEWAAQRIRNFSLFRRCSASCGLRRGHVTTLIEEFRYPRLGPGQMWEALPGPGRGARRAGGPRPPLRGAAPRGRARRGRSSVRADGDEARARGRRGPLEHPARRAGAEPRPRPRPSGARRGRAGCATAPSASWR